MKKFMFIFLISAISITALIAFFTCKNLKMKPKHFADTHIIFFPGGSQNDSFASVVYTGAKSASEDLGCQVEYMWSGWDSAKMALQLKEAIEKNPDAICLMGHPGAEALSPLINEAIRKNIIVTFQNVDLPDIRQNYAEKGLGYVGQDVYSSGLTLSRGCVRKFNLPPNSKALIIAPLNEEYSPNYVFEGRSLRTKGCLDGLKENGINVFIEKLPLTVEQDPMNSADYFSKIFTKYPDIKLLITDHGAITAAMNSILPKINKKPGDLIVAGFDLSEETVAGIKNGYVGLVHDQQPYLQGYLPILQACLTKKYGFAGLYIDTGVGLVDISNIENLEPLAKQKIR